MANITRTVATRSLAVALAEHLTDEAWDKALVSARQILANEPGHEPAMRGLVKAAFALGLAKEALRYCDPILQLSPLEPDVWHMSALCAFHVGDASAFSRAQRACELAPRNPDYTRTLRMVAAKAIPSWHFNMMNDVSRNFAYADAIARHVKGKLVLEIGTGAGLLALLAAKYGARRVITCESNVVLADVARQIVALNGLSQIITVVPKRSTELVVGDDLPEAADLLITETFSSLVVGEKVLQSLADARARLLQPAARVIPAVAACCCALVSSAALRRLARVESAFGFDLSPLNQFVPEGIGLTAPLSDIAWMSDAADAFAFNFNGPPPAGKGRARVELVATVGGQADGVIAWMRLDLDDQIAFENKPIAETEWLGHWKPFFFPFLSPLRVSPSQRVGFESFYSRSNVTLDLNNVALI